MHFPVDLDKEELIERIGLIWCCLYGICMPEIIYCIKKSFEGNWFK